MFLDDYGSGCFVDGGIDDINLDCVLFDKKGLMYAVNIKLDCFLVHEKGLIYAIK